MLKNELRTVAFFIVRGYNDKVKSPKELYEITSIDDLLIERDAYEYDAKDFDWVKDELSK